MSKIKVNSISSLSGQKVEFPNGVSGDGSGLYFQPNVISFDPVATSTGISTTTNITILFDQDVEFSGVGTIYIREDSPSGTISTYFTCGVSTEATIAGSTLVIDPRDPLSFGQLYVVTLPSVGIANTYGQYHRGTQGYSFTTAAQAFSASGGNSEFTIASPTSPTGYHKYHVFTSTGILTTTDSSVNATSLSGFIIAGGGASGGSPPSPAVAGGGGGAGGLVPFTGPTLSLDAGTYTITIGAGGAAPAGPFSINFGGENSTISTPTSTLVTAYGGGAGGQNFGPVRGPTSPIPGSPAKIGEPGGSGGGGGAPVPSISGTGVPGQGNPGGPEATGPTAPTISSSGGGAGGAGGAFSAPINASYGGSGSSQPEFTSPLIGPRVPTIPANSLTAVGPTGLYGGGGGGGNGGPIANGGPGGGGNSWAHPGGNFAGRQSTGGGAGAGYNPPTVYGGSGGSGVFMIRYAVPAP